MGFDRMNGPDHRMISAPPSVNSETTHEAAALAQRLFNCYPPPAVGDPRLLLSAAIATMQMFPIDVVRAVCDPVHGIPSTNKFAPNLAELRNALEVLDAPRQRAMERAAAEEKQLSERKQLRIEHARPRKTYEQLQAELAEVGIFIGQGKAGLKPMKAEDIQAKYGVTKEQWDAIPNAEVG